MNSLAAALVNARSTEALNAGSPLAATRRSALEAELAVLTALQQAEEGEAGDTPSAAEPSYDVGLNAPHFFLGEGFGP